MTPVRIKRERTRGWRMPPNTVPVCRPSKWGNPIRIMPERSEPRGRVMYRVHGSPMDVTGGPSYNLIETARHFATKFFEWDLLNGRYGDAYPSLEDIRRELAGRNLACWCPLVDAVGEHVPCHADVLLEIANQEVGDA